MTLPLSAMFVDRGVLEVRGNEARRTLCKMASYYKDYYRHFGNDVNNKI